VAQRLAAAENRALRNGKSIAMRNEFNEPVAQVFNDEVHFHGGPPAVPPEGSVTSTHCPQCGHTTWRYTQHCVHCGVDVFAWHARLNQERAQRQRNTTFMFFAAASASMFATGAWLMPDLKVWMYTAGVVLGFFAYGLIG
jgi:hypothetical protein